MSAEHAVGLLAIEQFLIPRGILLRLQAVLQEAGLETEERFALLSGVCRKPSEALVKSISIPDQTAGIHKRGLSVTIPGSELHRLNREWSQRGEQLFAQAHSHPGHPYHSAVDERYPIVAVEGGLSIVVPLFGFCPLLDLRVCAVFRLVDGLWRWLSPPEVADLVRIV